MMRKRKGVRRPGMKEKMIKKRTKKWLDGTLRARD